jgi:hypothetical protein
MPQALAFILVIALAAGAEGEYGPTLLVCL